MPDYDGLKPGEILADASVAEFISRLGLGIAEAQRALDENTIDQLAEFTRARDDLNGRTLLDLGLMPAFYHYQSADISCSLQLSLKVQKSLAVGVNTSINVKKDSATSETDALTETETRSGSETRTSSRTAAVTIKMNSASVLKVGGTDFAPEGTNPQARINDLTDKLRASDTSGIQRALAVPKTTPVNPTVEPPSDKVIASPNAVAFLTGGFDHGVIEIKAVPAAPEEFTLNPATKVTPALPAATRLAYATDLAAKITATGFRAGAYDSTTTATSVNFDFDKADIRPGEDAHRLERFAVYLKATGHKVRILGHTDRSGPSDYNIKLGNQRVDSIHKYLTDNGVAAAQLTKVASTGEKKWADQGLPDGVKSEAHRLGELMITDTNSAFVIIDGDASHELTGINPDNRGNPAAPGNGFVALYDAVNTNLATGGRKVVIKGRDFPLSGAAAGSNATHSPEAYAINLANAVNADPAVKVKAWPTGNVTNLANEGDEFSLELVTTESREIVLTGSEGVTITSQFSKTTTKSNTSTKSGNTSVAFGASVDVRYARSFEMTVTGNSAINARLVSIPAPPEFLATIKEFLRP
jgi:outer membrane protein OmpA-like peptidoglycan-associated protein